MAEYDVSLYVDGMVYVTVEASTEVEAEAKARALIGSGDFVEVEAIHVVIDEIVA
jgi:hypothetical protein